MRIIEITFLIVRVTTVLLRRKVYGIIAIVAIIAGIIILVWLPLPRSI